MRKTLFILLLFSMAWCSVKAVKSSYAILNKDTLRIGNSYMERCFLWNHGALKTIALTDKLHGTCMQARGERPDFAIAQGDARNGKMSSQWVLSDGVQPSHLEVIVCYDQGTLSVKRVFKVYENTPALACTTYLRGTMQKLKSVADVSNVDRKNIESAEDMVTELKTPTLDRIQLFGKHWLTKAVEFLDYTDWNDNLVFERNFIPYRKSGCRGNLLFAKDQLTDNGFFFLKESPSSSTQLHYTGSDFITDFNDFMVVSPGVSSADIKKESWTRLYGCVLGVFHGEERAALVSLRTYQKQLRKEKSSSDEMIMLNTWGDRSQDEKINEEFCMRELDRAAKLGITVFQLDDGWQSGKSPNSKTKGGSFKDIWKDNSYWTPNPMKFPHGLKNIVKRGKKLGIRIGLWFNPSVQNDFSDWEKDAQAIVSLYRQYGIECFKIDGLQIPTKQAEENLRHLFDKVALETNHHVIFNLDATAGRRGGYHSMNEYGNIFLENRYTDWGNYYPYRTLRNLWQLSRYVPAEKMQVEFLNKWRNADKYADNDIFAPKSYSFDYLFGITAAAQPLAWMEASNLPQEAYKVSPLIESYRKIQHDFHSGVILPIGDEPSGRSWTGFQSMTCQDKGYFIVYREDNDRQKAWLQTWLTPGEHVQLEKIAGQGASFVSQIDENGRLSFFLPEKNQFAIYQYKIEK